MYFHGKEERHCSVYPQREEEQLSHILAQAGGGDALSRGLHPLYLKHFWQSRLLHYDSFLLLCLTKHELLPETILGQSTVTDDILGRRLSVWQQAFWMIQARPSLAY